MMGRREAQGLVRMVARYMHEEIARGGFHGPHWLSGQWVSWVGDDLAGGCTIGAVLVVTVLHTIGVRAGVTAGYPTKRKNEAHWWATTSCGWTLDPTYGQFDGSIGPLATRGTSYLRAAGGVPIKVICADVNHPSLPRKHTSTVLRILGRLRVGEEQARTILGWSI